MLLKDLELIDSSKKTLEHLKLSESTPIQETALPYLLAGNSSIITSQTGSGKTLCYLLPIFNKIEYTNNTVQAIIILPTKELARQVYSKILDFKQDNKLLKASLMIGNGNLDQQIISLRKNPSQIVVGTTTRIVDLLQKKIFNPHLIKTVVLDEVDMLMDLGFANQVSDIMNYIDNPNLQKMACSATTHESLSNKLAKYFKNTKVISTSKSIWSNQQITNNVVYMKDNSNPGKTLLGLMKNINPYFCIIFCNTRNEVNDTFTLIQEAGFVNSVKIHKDLSTRQRKNIFREINENKYQYVVASDLISRGLDIEGADMVISFGLPEEDIWYMHRTGRVGRGKDLGEAFVIYKHGIDNILSRLTKKGINFNYQLLNNGELINKPLELHFAKKRRFDHETNEQIKRIIWKGSKTVKPGYKKKIKGQIDKIRQKVKHEYIEKRIHQTLMQKNIERTKAKKKW